MAGPGPAIHDLSFCVQEQLDGGAERWAKPRDNGPAKTGGAGASEKG